jgi:hypothetical protein
MKRKCKKAGDTLGIYPQSFASPNMEMKISSLNIAPSMRMATSNAMP